MKEHLSKRRTPNTKLLPQAFVYGEWFVVNDLSVSRDVTEVKFEADLSFANRDFEKAEKFYRQILDRSKGMGFVRDVLESLARCCLRLNKPEDALRWAVKLSVSFNLLAEVFHERCDFESEAACLASVILYHPILPDLWARLGRAYFETFIKDDRRDDRKLYFSAASYFRGIQLFRSVEKTVSSFAKEKNLATREKVEKEVESLNLKPEISNKIFDHVAKYLKMDEPEEIVEAEFEDLGKSARLKLIEESFRKLDAAEDVDERSVVSLASLAGFEQKMFHFLDEI